MRIQIPSAFHDIFSGKARYRIAHGGRGSAKSHTFAKMAVLRAYQQKILILCARELQNSITDSVHRLISQQIELLELNSAFEICKASIKCTNGSEFIFKGLRHNATEIKSTEGIDIAWVEEAERVSDDNWNTLIPTIRKPDSEIWITFNPKEKNAPTHKRFVLNTPPSAKIKEINYYDNPWFPDTLREEMEYMRRTDRDGYEHVWLGKCKESSNAQILNGKWIVDRFESPENWAGIYGPYYGADWGFAQDPTTLIRCWIKDNKLFIDHEVYKVGCELEDTPMLFDKVPGSRKHIIRADNSRPETISYIKRKGFKMEAAEKWPGSVEDGIAVLRSFETIVIHERCKHVIDEAMLYKYKEDKLTNDILPIIVDKNNHCIDAIRYALAPFIKRPNSRPAYSASVNILGR